MRTMNYSHWLNELKKELEKHPKLQANSNEKLRCYHQIASESRISEIKVCSAMSQMSKTINKMSKAKKLFDTVEEYEEIDEMIKRWADSPVENINHELTTVRRISAAIDELKDDD